MNMFGLFGQVLFLTMNHSLEEGKPNAEVFIHILVVV